MGVQLPMLHFFVECFHHGYQARHFCSLSLIRLSPRSPFLFKFTNVFFLDFYKDCTYFKIFFLKLKAVALAKYLLPNPNLSFALKEKPHFE